MSNTMRAMGKDEPLMQAWEAYLKTEEYRNTAQWAQAVVITPREIDGEAPVLSVSNPHLHGSLWACFMAGWLAAGGKIDAK